MGKVDDMKTVLLIAQHFPFLETGGNTYKASVITHPVITY